MYPQEDKSFLFAREMERTNGQYNRNGTSQTNSTESIKQILQYGLFVGQGSIISIGNLLIVLTIIRHRALRHRKELIVVCGLALADFLNGVAFLNAGIYRTFLIAQGSSEVLVSQWKCMCTAHNIIWIFSETISAAMLLVVSVDRLLAVSVPLRYFRHSGTYAHALLAMTYTYGLISGLSGVYVSYSTSPTTPPLQAICFTRMATGARFYDYYSMTRVVFGASSIVVYILVTIIYIRQQNQAKQAAAAYQRRIIKRQRKLTASLGISCIFTLFLYVLPHTAVFLESVLGRIDKSPYVNLQIHSYLFMLTNFNSLFNLFIFTIRHEEIRRGMCSLFHCRRKTHDYSSFLADHIFRPALKSSVHFSQHKGSAGSQTPQFRNKSSTVNEARKRKPKENIPLRSTIRSQRTTTYRVPNSGEYVQQIQPDFTTL